MTNLPNVNTTRGNDAVDFLNFRLPQSVVRPVTSLNIPKRELRKHPERQIVAMAASIREFGFLIPVLVDDMAEVICGVGRLLAAKRAGLTEVPVIAVDHLTNTQVRAFRIADNKLASLSSFDEKELAIEMHAIISAGDISVESLGFETAEIDLLLEGETSKASDDPADEILELPVDPVTVAGDLWSLQAHRLLCGSSLEALSWDRLMWGQTAAMSFVDAPYNVPARAISGLGATKHVNFAMASGEMSETEFIEFNTTYLTHLSAHLKDGAILFACMDGKHAFEIQSGARSAGLKQINLCVWNKTNGGMGSLYRSKHELVFVFKKGTASHTNNVKLGATGRYRCNVWDYAGANSFGRSRMEDLADHPTVKPTALVADAIRDVSHIGEIVTDAFMGSGTTILAAQRTGRIAYGIEIEPRYVDVALRRWIKMTGIEPTLEATGETFSEVRARREAERKAQSDSAPPRIVARSRERTAA